MQFNGPIPGESLTRTPGNAPWEQPPQHTKVEDAAAIYMDRLDDDETMEDLLFILGEGMPIDVMVESLLMNGEMQGKHTADVSILIGPILHEHMISLAEAAGVEYREFQGYTKEEKKRNKFLEQMKLSIGKGSKTTGDDSGLIAETEKVLSEASTEVAQEGEM